MNTFMRAPCPGRQTGTAAPGDIGLLSERPLLRAIGTGSRPTLWVPHPVDARATLQGGQRARIHKGRRDDPQLALNDVPPPSLPLSAGSPQEAGHTSTCTGPGSCPAKGNSGERKGFIHKSSSGLEAPFSGITTPGRPQNPSPLSLRTGLEWSDESGWALGLGSPVLEAGSRDPGQPLAWVWKMLLLWSIGQPAAGQNPSDSLPAPCHSPPQCPAPNRGFERYNRQAAKCCQNCLRNFSDEDVREISKGNAFRLHKPTR